MFVKHIYILNVYEFYWPMYTDLGRPGDTFAVAGGPSNLVFFNYLKKNSQFVVACQCLLRVIKCISGINYIRLPLVTMTNHTKINRTMKSLFNSVQCSKTCDEGTPLYPGQSVPTWQVSLRHRFAQKIIIWRHHILKW